MTRAVRGGIAGAVAATVWTFSDPIFKRAFRTPYSDAELLGPFLTQGPLEPVADAVTHAAGGFAFGAIFARLGGHGPRQGVVAALAENTLFWPATAVFDRIHPKRKSGEWPPLFKSSRAFAAATAGHAFFGLLLGVFVGRE